MSLKKPLSKFEWAPARLLEEMAEGISIQDLDMRIHYANRALRDFFGEEIVGKLCYEVYERRAQRCEGCPVKECLATGEPVSGQRVGFDTNGVPWFADITATPLRNPDGEIVGAVETVRNVTDRKLIEQEADKRNRETAALAEIAVALNSNVNLDDILVVALERSVAICGASGGLIRLLDEESGLLVNRAWYSANNELILEDLLPPQRLGIGPLFTAAQTAEILIRDDITQDKDMAATKHGRALLELGLSSIAMVPLASKGKVFGTLALGSFERAKFSHADKGLLSAIADQISVSIENARLIEALRADSENARAQAKEPDDRT